MKPSKGGKNTQNGLKVCLTDKAVHMMKQFLEQGKIFKKRVELLVKKSILNRTQNF